MKFDPSKRYETENPKTGFGERRRKVRLGTGVKRKLGMYGNLRTGFSRRRSNARFGTGVGRRPGWCGNRKM